MDRSKSADPLTRTPHTSIGNLEQSTVNHRLPLPTYPPLRLKLCPIWTFMFYMLFERKGTDCGPENESIFQEESVFLGSYWTDQFSDSDYLSKMARQAYYEYVGQILTLCRKW